MSIGWSLGGQSILWGVVWILANITVTQCAPAELPPVVIAIGTGGACDDVTIIPTNVPLFPATQVYVPISKLPVWNVQSVQPARVVVLACTTLAGTNCRSVVLSPTAQRCTELSLLGVVVFGDQSLVSSAPLTTVYATLAIVMVAVFLMLGFMDTPTPQTR